MDKHPLNPDARALEEAFFAKKDAELLEKLRKESRQKERRKALRGVLPSADDALLDHLHEIGLGPETVLALVLVPLVAVAWADGQVDPRERAALLKAAEERGVKEGSPARQLLEGWLQRRPGPQLFETWKRYAPVLRGSLQGAERDAMHARIIDLARGVAEAAGGFLGLGSKTSPAERAVLDELERTLG
jgi:tellurite resistance protein